MNLVDFAVLSFASVFVIVDPIALVPSFLAMTSRDSANERIRIAALASAITCFILLFFSFTGQWVFKIFGVTLPAFEIAGGIVLGIIALDMLQARRPAVKETREEEEAGMSREDVAVFPLAIPFLAGPGAITAVILLAAQAITPKHQAVLVGNIILISILVFLILSWAAMSAKFLNIIALKVITRLLGLILASIAVQFIVNGIKGLGFI